jgi:RNA polymerase sigma-70 factor, ECF subfamily
VSLATALPTHLLPLTEVLIDSTVLAAQRGDEAAFAALYDAHAARVYALCLGLAGDRATAAELVQDVFVRVWENLDSFRGDCAFSTWLHRVAVNVALESERKGRRRSLKVQIAADLRLVPGASRAPEPDAAAKVADPALRMDLERAIARLSAGARAVFVLHDVEGFQHAEIGEKLGIAEGTSKAHLFRARRLLREMLQP